MTGISGDPGSITTTEPDSLTYVPTDEVDETSAGGLTSVGDDQLSLGTLDLGTAPVSDPDTPTLPSPTDEITYDQFENFSPDYPTIGETYEEAYATALTKYLFAQANTVPPEQRTRYLKQLQFAHDFPELVTDETLLEFIAAFHDTLPDELKEQLPEDYDPGQVFYSEEEIANAANDAFANALDAHNLGPEQKMRLMGAHYTGNTDNLTADEKELLATIQSDVNTAIQEQYGAPSSYTAPIDTAYFNNIISHTYNQSYQAELEAYGFTEEQMQTAEFFHNHPDRVADLTAEQREEFASILEANQTIENTLINDLATQYGISKESLPPPGAANAYNALLVGAYVMDFDGQLAAYAEAHSLSPDEVNLIKQASINPNAPNITDEIRAHLANVKQLTIEGVLTKFNIPVAFDPLATTAAANFNAAIAANPQLMPLLNTIQSTQSLVNTAIGVVNQMPDSPEKGEYLEFLKTVMEALTALTEFLFVLMATDSKQTKLFAQAELETKLHKLEEQKKKMDKIRKKRKKAKRLGKIMKGIEITTQVLMVALAVGLAAPFGPVAMAVAATLAATLAADRIGGFGLADGMMGGFSTMGTAPIRAVYALAGKKPPKDVLEGAKIMGQVAGLATLAAIAGPGSFQVLIDVAFTEGPMEDIFTVMLEQMAKMPGMGWADSEIAIMVVTMVAFMAASAGTGRSAYVKGGKVMSSARASDRASTVSSAQKFKNWAMADLSRARAKWTGVGDYAKALKDMRMARNAFLKDADVVAYAFKVMAILDGIQIGASTTQQGIAIEMHRLRANNALREGKMEAWAEEIEQLIQVIRTAIDNFLAVLSGEGGASDDIKKIKSDISQMLGDLSRTTSQITAANLY